jgi:hypothetical protein
VAIFWRHFAKEEAATAQTPPNGIINSRAWRISSAIDRCRAMASAL